MESPEPPPRVVNRIDGSVSGIALQVGTLQIGAAVPPPRQLPAAPGLFTGRENETAALTAALDSAGENGATMVISAIGGAGGIGKTWLALHWAHQNIDRFPDGQLFVNLRGFDPVDEPMLPAVAVRGFLGALGIDPAAIPADLDAQTGLYRSLVADKRMLIVLDNVRDVPQLQPLLPGSPGCTVVVTSRHRLDGLATGHSAKLFDLDVLSESSARDLLSNRLGPGRLTAEPDAVAELLAFCAGLPLALSIVAARAHAHPGFPLSALAEELREIRLDAFDTGDPHANLRAVVASSCRALGPVAVTAFGLLGLAGGPDIGLPAAVSLLDLPAAKVRIVLRELENSYLVQQHVPGRYRMHDLVRLHAIEEDLPAEVRGDAVDRLVNFYLHTAYNGDRLLDADAPPIHVQDPPDGCVPHPLPDAAAALDWFDTEHACLLAAQRLTDADLSIWQLAWTLNIYHQRRGHIQAQITSWRAGLAAAERLGDKQAQTRAHRRLGYAYTRAGLPSDALEHLRYALTRAEHTGDKLGQASAHLNLASAWEELGDVEQALGHAGKALQLYQTKNRPIMHARALNAVGWYQARLGDYVDARVSCGRAVDLFVACQDRVGEASALDSLGYIARGLGEHATAIDLYQRALALFRAAGDNYQEADTLDDLAQTRQALGQHMEARDTWRQAMELYAGQHRVADVDRVRLFIVSSHG